MTRPSYEFTAQIDGLTFPDGESIRVRIPAEHGSFLAVMSTPTPGVLSIQLTVVGNDRGTPETRDTEVADAAAILVDRLAFACDLGVGAIVPVARGADPIRTPSPMSITTHGDVTMVNTSDTLRVSVAPENVQARRVLVYGAGRGDDVARQLARPLRGERLFHSLYREVVRSRDVLVRFIMLYEALAVVVGSQLGPDARAVRQRDVDSWIQTREPQVEITSTGPGGRDETSYTRTRNDIVHGAGRDVDPDVVRRRASRLCDHLRGLVKVAATASSSSSSEVTTRPDGCAPAHH